MTLALTDPSTSSLGAALDVTRASVRWGLAHALPVTVMRANARRGDLHGALFTKAADDYWSLFEEMRRQGPLYRGRLSYATVSHATVREVLSHPDFRTGFDRASLPGPLGAIAEWSQQGAPMGPLTPPSLLAVEPPDHTRYRKLVTRVFSARAIGQLRERTVEVAEGLLDRLEGRDEVDLVEEYCAQLPVIMIAEVLGIPAEDHARVRTMGEGASPSLDLGLSYGDFRRVESSLVAFRDWLGAHLERLRANPGTDLLSQLLEARVDGRGLTDEEVKATAGLVLVAGFETTVNLLGNGVSLLVDHPAQLADLRTADSAAWGNAVDEILRLDPPVLLTGRSTQVDTEVAGRRVRAGSVVATILAAANRDPDVFDRPGVFDVTRANAADHVSFSGGRHYCLGAQLARMEGEVGLSRLFARYPDLQVLPGARRRTTRILRGFTTLPVRL